MWKNKKRGIVLVTGLLVLALLSLMGAGSLISSHFDVSAVSNQKSAKQVFYSAETAVDAAVFELANNFELSSQSTYGFAYTSAATGAVNTSAHYIDGSAFNGFSITRAIELPPGTVTATPVAGEYSTMENNLPIGNLSRSYVVKGMAQSNTANDSAEVRETVRVLARPLTQYLAFYNGDMEWSPNTNAVVNGGRVYASGNITFTPGGTLHFASNANMGSNAITAGGSIIPAGGNTDIAVPNAGGGSADVAINTSLSALTKGVQETRFAFGTDSVVRAGVDTLRTIGHGAIERGNLYEDLASQDAAAGATAGVDTFIITDDSGGLDITLRYYDNGGTLQTVDVSAAVDGFLDSTGALMAFNAWAGGRINADGSNVGFIPGTIVYSKERQPTLRHSGGGYPVSCTGIADMNPDYPSLLEENDPREGKAVEFIVIDLQRLENWYDDYIRSAGVANPAGRKLLIYAARAPSVGLSAIKIVGSENGRFRAVGVADPAMPPASPAGTILFPTTIASPNPVYLEGDFNVSGQCCVIIADAVTLLSNQWGNNHYDGAALTGAADTRINAGLIAGRTSGADPVEDLARKIEDWTGTTFTFTGSLVSPWASTMATGAPIGINAPTYAISWDPAFRSILGVSSAPYVPMTYSIEREVWREE